MTMTKTRTLKAPDLDSSPLAFELPPDLTARAFLNLRAVAKLGTLRTWWLEYHEGRGCYLVTTGGPCTFAAWVPADPGQEDELPDLRREPNAVIGFTDPDGRLANLMERLSKAYSGDLAPGQDEQLQVRPGQRVDGTQLAMAGLAAPVLSIWSSGERHDVPGSEVPVVGWRTIVRTFEHTGRDNLSLAPELFKAIGAVRGMKPAKLMFGTGSNALCRFTPETGGWCHIIAVVDIGRRETEPEPTKPEPIGASTEAGELPALRHMGYDEDTGAYFELSADDE